MLATVLAGIAIGGAIAARLLKRPRDWALWLATIQMATAALCLASAVFLGWSYNAGWRTSGDWQASAVAILPVTILMGLGFPIALHLAAAPKAGDQIGAVAQRVGRIYSLNVLGAIIGALVSGFVILPSLGTRRALVAMAAVYGASALLLAVGHPQRRRLLIALAAPAVVFLALIPRVPDPFTAAYERRYGRDMREFWREEGAQTAVSVHASNFRRSLYLDGLHQANDGPEMVQLHRTIGHLPMVLHPNPKEALVIGLGGGATSGAVSQHRGTRVQIVELSESVRKAAPFFAHVNYDVLNQPNVRIRVDDGRNFLLLSGETFDVITADIIQPIHAGAGNLYSREYFSLVRRALKPGGIALQWIGHRPPTQYKLIMRTFLEVFPHATLWLDGNLMVASLTPLRLNLDTVAAQRQDPVTAAALDEIGLRTFEDLRGWYSAGPDEMRRFVGAGPLLTDDRPLLDTTGRFPASQTRSISRRCAATSTASSIERRKGPMRALILIGLGAIAGAATLSGAQALQRVNPPGLSTPQTYSHVVRAGNTVYVAGQVGANAQGAVVGPGMREQTEQVLANLDAALKSQKLDVSHVAKINIYVTSIDEFRAPDVAALRAKFFGTNRPASTLVQVVRLADPAYKIEIEAIAIAP